MISYVQIDAYFIPSWQLASNILVGRRGRENVSKNRPLPSIWFLKDVLRETRILTGSKKA